MSRSVMSVCFSLSRPTQHVTMATSLVCDEPSDMECTVCHEHFTFPKLLPCDHLLCRHCLVTRLKSQPEAKCPVCGCTIVKQHACRVCVNVAAVSICLTCGDMFCQSCSTMHKKQSVTEHHKVESLASLTVEKLAANRPATCTFHYEKMSEVYCPTHGASICFLCARTDHRQCPAVTKLEKRMEEVRAELAELTAMLSAGETELDTAMSNLDQYLQEKRTQAAVAEIEATADRLESAVKAWRRRLKELALSKCAEAKTAVTDGKTLFLQRRGRLTTHKHVTHRVQGFSTHGSFGDMATLLKTRVYGLDRSAILPAGAKILSTMTLTIDQQALSRIEQELSHLCEIIAIPVDASFQVSQH